MKIIKYILFFILTLSLFNSCKGSIDGEVTYVYDKKSKIHSVTFPEYNYIYPQLFTLPIKNVEINPSIFISYEIDSENIVYTLNVIIETDKNTIHEYNIYNPPIGRKINVQIFPSDFKPKINEDNVKISKISVSINSVGEGTSKDSVSLRVLNEKHSATLLEKNILHDLLIPNSGHYSKSNPPFIYWKSGGDITTVLLSKSDSFQENETIEYKIRNRKFFTPKEALDEGKWNVAFIDNNNLSKTNRYSFFIGEQSAYINAISKPTNKRPFILLNTNRINTLSFWYNYYKNGRVAKNMLGRNMKYLADYVKEADYKWDIKKVVFEKNSEMYNQTNLSGVDDVINIDEVPTYAMNFQLVSLFDTNQTNITSQMKSIVSDISLLSISNIRGYSEIELANLLSIPLITSLNWHHDRFTAQEIIDIKVSLVDKAGILYKYFTENPNEYYDIKNTDYIITLALISMALYNESFEENNVRDWYDFSSGYIASLILTQIGDNGELPYDLSDSYNFLFPIINYAISLNNATGLNLFRNSYFMNSPKYLTTMGFRGGYINPTGDNIVNRYSILRNDDFIETSVMEAMARIYGNSVYKMHADYGINDAITNKYLPYMILFNSDDINMRNIRRNIAKNPYVFSYFSDIETIIYNPSPFTNNDAYFMVHGKQQGIGDKEGSHNDSMSFLYYNYGDMFIDDAGFFGENESDYYNFLKSFKAHSGISIDDNDMINHGASYSYIDTYTNDRNYIYVKMKSSEIYTYPLILDDYTRRFYYIKPDILVIKDNIKALADINNPKYGGRYFYTWRFTTRLDVNLNYDMNMFSILGKNSTANVYFINDDRLEYVVKNDKNLQPKNLKYEIPQLNICEVTTSDRVSKFSPWVLIVTEKYNRAKNLEILEANNNMISFIVDGRQYTINYSDTNQLSYNRNRRSIIINSN